jgi:hypothetical protein
MWNPRPERMAQAIAVLFFAALAASAAQAAASPVFPIAAVIAQVKQELATAQNAPGAGLVMALEKVEVTLAVSRVVDANGKVTIGVPSMGLEVGGGAGRKSEESSTLYVELVPPKGGGILGATEIENFGLAEAIVDTRRQLLKGLADEPKLDPRKVIISVKFGVARTAGPTGQLKLIVISVGAGQSVTSADTNTVVLTFSAKPVG